MNLQSLKLCLSPPLRLFFCGKGINKCAYGICNYCSVKLQLLIEFVHWRNALVVVLSLKSSQDNKSMLHAPLHTRVPWIQVINSVYILDWLLCSSVVHTYIFSKCVHIKQNLHFHPHPKLKNVFRPKKALTDFFLKILGIIEQVSKICVWCLNSWKKPFNHATSTRWALTFQNLLREKTNYSLCTNLWVSSSVFFALFS